MNTYILPLSKNKYVFCGANNRVDAWTELSRDLSKKELKGKSYKDIMTTDEYFKIKSKRYKKVKRFLK